MPSKNSKDSSAVSEEGMTDNLIEQVHVAQPTHGFLARCRSLFDWFFFIRPLKVVSIGARRVLRLQDLPLLEYERDGERCYQMFLEKWKIESQKPKPSLSKLIVRMFSGRIFLSFLAMLLSFGLQLLPPVLIPNFIDFILSHQTEGREPQPVMTAWILTIIVMISMIVGTILSSHAMTIMVKVAIQIRSIVIVSVFRKSLKISSTAGKTFDTGHIITLMSNDTTRMADTMQFISYGLVAPIMVIAILVLIARLIGVYMLIGLAAVCVITPVNAFIAKMYTVYRRQIVAFTDKRTKLENDLFQGIRVIKFYGWEESFISRILGVRKDELHLVMKLSYIRAGLVFFMMFTPTLTSTLTFLAYSQGADSFDAGTVFSALALFTLLRLPLMMTPFLVAILAQNKVAMERAQAFLEVPEVEEDAGTGETHLRLDVNQSKNAVEIKNGSFEWKFEEDFSKAITSIGVRRKKGVQKESGAEEKERDEVKEVAANVDLTGSPKKRGKRGKKSKKGATKEEVVENDGNAQAKSNAAVPFKLEDINLTIRKGQLVMIVGEVGSGKSSLVQALLNEMVISNGVVKVAGEVAYVPQSAWIMNATVRENILFGRDYNSKKYKQVLKATALESDLELLVAGDMTEIGERGINLSGGQRARVSLARAMYGTYDLLILDDPLSAVDAHVGKHIFQHCVLEMAKKSTRLMVVNQLQFLPRADLVVVMKDGTISEQGTYGELVKAGLNFARLMHEFGHDDEEEESEKHEGLRKSSLRSSKPVGGDTEHATEEEGKMMSVETKETGAVSSKVYLRMAKLGGVLLFIGVVGFTTLMVTAKNAGSWWLSPWTAFESLNEKFQGIDDSTYYLLIFLAFGLAEGLFVLLAGISFAFFMINVSRNIHERLVKRVALAPMSFFDTTPIGRILNRLSADLDLIDNRLPHSLQQYIVQFLSAIGLLTVCSFASPYMLLVVTPMAVVYYVIQKYYRFSSIEMQRIEALCRSPIFSHFQQSLIGLSSIRAYKIEDRVRLENLQHMNRNSRVYYILRYSANWFNLVLGFLGAVIVFFVCLMVILFRETLSPGIAGLTLTYATMVTQTLMGLSRQAAEAEKDMNGVERVGEYGDVVPQEAAHFREGETEEQAVQQWPSNGAVEFSNVTLRYREELPAVLKGVSFKIADKSSIGIVGRTGSGKSTIMNALLRIVEIDDDGGSITIGGQNIKELGLNLLRTKLAIIPQEPVLFIGTVRYNIDPTGVASDADIWSALKLSGLEEVISNVEGKLDGEVEEGGSNFSVGQRQLICFARALVRKPKLLLADEATASVDLETDQKIQKMIRQHFADCTVITIAHRLNTVVDCDKVMVLEDGCLVEYDTPYNLLKSLKLDDDNESDALDALERKRSTERESKLASLVQATGKSSSRRLFSIASNREKSRRLEQQQQQLSAEQREEQHTRATVTKKRGKKKRGKK